MEFLVIWILFGVASSMIASKKGRDGCAWFAMGALLGPFGLLFAFIAGDARPTPEPGVVRGPTSRARWAPDEAEKRCPDCQEPIKLQARVCRYCQRQFDPEEVEREVNTARDDFADRYPEAIAWRGRVCPACGGKSGPSFERCKQCGQGIDDVPVTYELDGPTS